ncbi:hypothetical protein SAY87_001551 [Trapa incisa]|uniref:Pentatricopeptide repeat-containing protein n=1 Tax=Trapa incisa TaxID=236973 RepID=A0AAN7GIP2_9MYRT|nr:hypothetical protein SAY87_001551 [Trapa incisa]
MYGHWDDAIQIRGMMTENGVVKTRGFRTFGANGMVREVLAGDRKHPQIHEIEQKLEEMGRRLKMEGYASNMTEVFLKIDEVLQDTVRCLQLLSTFCILLPLPRYKNHEE